MAFRIITQITCANPIKSPLTRVTSRENLKIQRSQSLHNESRQVANQCHDKKLSQSNRRSISQPPGKVLCQEHISRNLYNYSSINHNETAFDYDSKKLDNKTKQELLEKIKFTSTPDMIKFLQPNNMKDYGKSTNWRKTCDPNHTINPLKLTKRAELSYNDALRKTTKTEEIDRRYYPEMSTRRKDNNALYKPIYVKDKLSYRNSLIKLLQPTNQMPYGSPQNIDLVESKRMKQVFQLQTPAHNVEEKQDANVCLNLENSNRLNHSNKISKTSDSCLITRKYSTSTLKSETRINNADDIISLKETHLDIFPNKTEYKRKRDKTDSSDKIYHLKNTTRQKNKRKLYNTPYVRDKYSYRNNLMRFLQPTNQLPFGAPQRDDHFPIESNRMKQVFLISSPIRKVKENPINKNSVTFKYSDNLNHLNKISHSLKGKQLTDYSVTSKYPNSFSHLKNVINTSKPSTSIRTYSTTTFNSINQLDNTEDSMSPGKSTVNIMSEEAKTQDKCNLEEIKTVRENIMNNTSRLTEQNLPQEQNDLKLNKPINSIFIGSKLNVLQSGHSNLTDFTVEKDVILRSPWPAYSEITKNKKKIIDSKQTNLNSHYKFATPAIRFYSTSSTQEQSETIKHRKVGENIINRKLLTNNIMSLQKMFLNPSPSIKQTSQVCQYSTHYEEGTKCVGLKRLKKRHTYHEDFKDADEKICPPLCEDIYVRADDLVTPKQKSLPVLKCSACPCIEHPPPCSPSLKRLQKRVEYLVDHETEYYCPQPCDIAVRADDTLVLEPKKLPPLNLSSDNCRPCNELNPCAPVLKRLTKRWDTNVDDIRICEPPCVEMSTLRADYKADSKQKLSRKVLPLLKSTKCPCVEPPSNNNYKQPCIKRLNIPLGDQPRPCPPTICEENVVYRMDSVLGYQMVPKKLENFLNKPNPNIENKEIIPLEGTKCIALKRLEKRPTFQEEYKSADEKVCPPACEDIYVRADDLEKPKQKPLPVFKCQSCPCTDSPPPCSPPLKRLQKRVEYLIDQDTIYICPQPCDEAVRADDNLVAERKKLPILKLSPALCRRCTEINQCAPVLKRLTKRWDTNVDDIRICVPPCDDMQMLRADFIADSDAKTSRKVLPLLKSTKCPCIESASEKNYKQPCLKRLNIPLGDQPRPCPPTICEENVFYRIDDVLDYKPTVKKLFCYWPKRKLNCETKRYYSTFGDEGTKCVKLKRLQKREHFEEEVIDADIKVCPVMPCETVVRADDNLKLKPSKLAPYSPKKCPCIPINPPCTPPLKRLVKRYHYEDLKYDSPECQPPPCDIIENKRADDVLTHKRKSLPQIIDSAIDPYVNAISEQPRLKRLVKRYATNVDTPRKCFVPPCSDESNIRADDGALSTKKKTLPNITMDICPCNEYITDYPQPCLKRLNLNVEEPPRICEPTVCEEQVDYRMDNVLGYEIKRKKLSCMFPKPQNQQSKNYSTLSYNSSSNNCVYDMNLFQSSRTFITSTPNKKDPGKCCKELTKCLSQGLLNKSFNLSNCDQKPKNDCDKEYIAKDCNKNNAPYPSFSECNDEEYISGINECKMTKEDLQPKYPIIKAWQKNIASAPTSAPVDPLIEEECLIKKMCISRETSDVCPNFKEEYKPLRAKDLEPLTRIPCSTDLKDTDKKEEIKPFHSKSEDTKPKVTEVAEGQKIKGECEKLIIPNECITITEKSSPPPEKTTSSPSQCPEFTVSCPKPWWQKIIEYFKARPNCPEPDEWKKKALREKAEKAAKAVGLELCEPQNKDCIEKQKSIMDACADKIKFDNISITEFKESEIKENTSKDKTDSSFINRCEAKTEEKAQSVETSTDRCNTEPKKESLKFDESCPSGDPAPPIAIAKTKVGDDCVAADTCKRLKSLENCPPKARHTCNKKKNFVPKDCCYNQSPYPSFGDIHPPFKRLPVNECREAERRIRKLVDHPEMTFSECPCEIEKSSKQCKTK